MWFNQISTNPIIMRKTGKFLQIVFLTVFLSALTLCSKGQFPRFKVLAFYNTSVEKDHVDFSNSAIRFFKDLTSGNGFVFDTTSDMANLNEDKIKGYQLLMMINDFPHSPSQRAAFEKYM